MKIAHNKFNINSFLKFGFYLDSEVNEYKFPFDKIQIKDYSNFDESEIIDIAYIKLKKTVKTLYDKAGGNSVKHVVPISGGLDSRIILAMLAKLANSKNLYTYTYGVPGTWNFEIGKKISEILGANHREIILTSRDYNIDTLTDASSRFNHRVPVFFHPNFIKLDTHFSNHVVWSGFLGCLWKGKTLPKVRSASKEEAVNFFINFNNINASKLCIQDDNYFKEFLLESISEESPINFDDQLSFKHRQKKYVFNYVNFNGQREIVYPLLDREMINFWLSIDYEKQRQNSHILKKMASKYFPILNYIENTENYGHSLNGSELSYFLKKYSSKLENRLSRIFPSFTPKHTNYINFQRAFFMDNKFKNTIKSLMYSLDERDVVTWINIKKLFNEVCSDSRKSVYELLLLSSLEIQLRSNDAKS